LHITNPDYGAGELPHEQDNGVPAGDKWHIGLHEKSCIFTGHN